ncbi:MAG: SpoIID/LytB domain-containing protein, partial [Elusimicrobia bacterium]|nr:SpoIID/LytB domain-containing protein [Elusimicrobiota bacterium]
AALDAAVCWRDVEDHKRARAMLQAALALDPKDADVLAELGWEAARSRDPKAARRAFARALAVDSRQPRALLGLARLELNQSRPRAAAEAARRLLAARPQDTLGLVALADAETRLGRLAQAAEAWQSAYESDPSFVFARYQRAALDKRLGRFDDAWLQYSKVLAAAPNEEEARRGLASLKGRLTKPPAEIVPPRALKAFAPVVTARPGRVPVVRVGIGTTVSGRPAPKPEVAFLCDGPFEVYDPAGGRRITQGPPDRAWRARRAKGGGYELVDSDGRRRARFRGALGIRPLDPKRHSIIVQRLRLSAGTAWAEQGDRQLRGSVELRALGRRGLYLVDVMGLEDYLYGVVTEEMPGRFPLEALKAQAVIARNQALISKDIYRPHRKWGYDLCDGQHCQVYGGLAAESALGRKAVDDTRGLVLEFKGRLAQTPYSSDCGGHTQSSAEVGGWTPEPYLVGVKDVDGGGPELKSPWQMEMWIKKRPDVYCNIPGKMPPELFRWERLVRADSLAKRLGRHRRFGALRRLVVLRRSVSGNVNKLLFVGTRGRVVLDREAAIRRLLSEGSVRDTMFTLESERDARGRLTDILVYGGGWGHNVGLCQYGAMGRALAGKGFRSILAHYFRGAKVHSLGY